MSTQNDTKASFTSKQSVGKKASKKRSVKRKQKSDGPGVAVSTAASTTTVTPKAVVDVDESSTPVQEADVSPINAVGFESGNVEYVRPTPDTVQVPNQRYWVMSYVTSTGKGMRSKNTMVKCSGCFADEQSAGRHAETIRNIDPRINVFVVEMYNFVSVPIPLHIFEGLRKHYIDERLDRIMYENYLEVKRDRKLMEMRTKADKEKALSNLRQAKGNPNYVPPDHTEFVQQQMQQEADRYHEMKEAESNFEGADIIAALQKVMKDATATKSDETTTATPSLQQQEQQPMPGNKEMVEAFATKLLETLIGIRQSKMATELSQQEESKALAERSIKDKHVPAVSDFDAREKTNNASTTVSSSAGAATTEEGDDGGVL